MAGFGRSNLYKCTEQKWKRSSRTFWKLRKQSVQVHRAEAGIQGGCIGWQQKQSVQVHRAEAVESIALRDWIEEAICTSAQSRRYRHRRNLSEFREAICTSAQNRSELVELILILPGEAICTSAQSRSSCPQGSHTRSAKQSVQVHRAEGGYRRWHTREYRKQSVQVHRAEVWTTVLTPSPTLKQSV